MWWSQLRCILDFWFLHGSRFPEILLASFIVASLSVKWSGSRICQCIDRRLDLKSHKHAKRIVSLLLVTIESVYVAIQKRISSNHHERLSSNSIPTDQISPQTWYSHQLFKLYAFSWPPSGSRMRFMCWLICMDSFGSHLAEMTGRNWKVNLFSVTYHIGFSSGKGQNCIELHQWDQFHVEAGANLMMTHDVWSHTYFYRPDKAHETPTNVSLITAGSLFTRSLTIIERLIAHNFLLVASVR